MDTVKEIPRTMEKRIKTGRRQGYQTLKLTFAELQRKTGKEYAMKLSTIYLAKGMFRIIRGTAKEITGKLSSNTKLGIKGKFERLTGKAQWKVGKVQGAVGL